APSPLSAATSRADLHARPRPTLRLRPARRSPLGLAARHRPHPRPPLLAHLPFPQKTGDGPGSRPMKQPGPDTVDALLYDFGGVIIEVDFERVFARWSELSGVPIAQVKERFTHGEEYNAHECG